MAHGVPLIKVAKVIRSKNAGPFELTLDVIFARRADYEAAKAAGAFSAQQIAELYRVPIDRVLAVRWFDAAAAVKIVLARPVVSGDLGERDVYGAQQHAPLLNLELPIEVTS